MSELENVRMHCSSKFVMCQNWKVSELESVRIGKCHNWKVSELDGVRIGKGENSKVSTLFEA